MGLRTYFQYGEIKSMFLNGFSLSIPESQEETSDGYVVLKHNQNFSIRLHNGHKFNGSCKPADAEVYVQGKHVGTFRVPYSQTVIIERSVDDTGKFTAYRNGTYEAQLAEIDAGDPNNGLIKVVWKPGYKCKPPIDYVNIIENTPNITWDNSVINSNHLYDSGTFTNHASFNTSSSARIGCQSNWSLTTRNCNLSGGGVGLSGHSDQSFSEVDSLVYDEAETTIFLRIAFRDEIRSIKQKRHKVYSTRVPRPLK